MLANYTFEEHRHNYSVWTAARAVSRNFTTTANIKKAIDSSGLRDFVNSDLIFSHDDFDRLHSQWAIRIIDDIFASTGKTVSYGRAAKIISIYLKTSVVLCSQGSCQKSMVIHPPIDAILLNNIAQKGGMPKLKDKRWTQLSESEYWKLTREIKTKLGSFDWRLEYFWKPDRS